MKLLKMAGHDCLLYSAAMVLDTEPAILISEIGHDGSEVWWEGHPHPFCRRGIHIQEVQDCAIRRQQIFYPYEAMPCSAPKNGKPKAIWSWEIAKKRFLDHITGKTGLLITPTHAVAWDGNMVYDPIGRISKIDNYLVREAWVLKTFKSF